MTSHLLPGQPFPHLDLPRVGGGRLKTGDFNPGFMTILNVYRGLHCPRCQRQLADIVANKARLERIVLQMQDAARRDPSSRYRQTQAKIARIHRSVWRTAAFRDLVATTETLLSVDPRVHLGREPVAEVTPAPAPTRRPQSIEPIPVRPPRVQD